MSQEVIPDTLPNNDDVVGGETTLLTTHAAIDNDAEIISSQDPTAVKPVFPNEPGEDQAVLEESKKKKKGGSRGVSNRGASVSMAKRAGILFPIARVHRQLKEHSATGSGRVAATASVYLAAVLEYLVAETLEVSGAVANAEKLHRITPHHITMGVRHDEELDRLFPPGSIAGGGVIPWIHRSLVPAAKVTAGAAKKGTEKTTTASVKA